MHQILHDCLGGLGVHYEKVANSIQRSMSEVVMILPSIVNESHPIATYFIRLAAKSHENLLISLFDTLSFLNSQNDSNVFTNMPSRLVSDQLRLAKCQNLQNKIKHLLQGKLLMNSSGGILDRLESIFLSDSDETDILKHYKLYESNKCVSELPSELESLLHTIKTINEEVVQFINAGSVFSSVGYLETERHYLETMQATAVWLSEQLTAFSENRTTQIKMSNEITHTKLQKMERTLNHIVSAVERKAIAALLSRANSILQNLQHWYYRSLTAIPNLVPFYDDSAIEDKMRALRIWRHPVARLKTADVLQFKYPASESWRSWELSTGLNYFVLSGRATNMVSNMLGEYIYTLRSQLTHVRLKCKRARRDVSGAFKDVVDHLTNVRIESSMGSNFVLWV